MRCTALHVLCGAADYAVLPGENARKQGEYCPLTNVEPSMTPRNRNVHNKYVGAQEGLLTREKLEELLTNAPENYLPVKIS